MKQILLAASTALLLLFSCKNDETSQPVPQDTNWYVLRSPDSRDIRAVHGNIDDRLVITTGFKIYTTDNKGKTWETSDYNGNVGLVAFMVKEDTLFAMEGKRSSATAIGDSFGTQPYWFSLNKGLNWKPMRGRPGLDEWQVPINYAYSGNGIKFSIAMEQTPEGYLNTKGVVSESGSKISFPARHQLINVHFDGKSRLYVSGSAPICGEGENFKYCDDPNGSVYISRKPVLF
ncbi:hypothetical protein SAMN05216327_105361 [Dyadobacter sp. SG02]|uniref:hypothetical protein n=1 Tax=Dyadobacter sp. SG02 TaxID=1855291 RepID=UPI0008BC1A1A|nr:hypothetical protein [Dyadobacter sp. SG02]SEJ02935.1 hypothetical protein SAMN05216327_105361 [Dyadobacter sp. SG02]